MEKRWTAVFCRLKSPHFVVQEATEPLKMTERDRVHHAAGPGRRSFAQYIQIFAQYKQIFIIATYYTLKLYK